MEVLESLGIAPIQILIQMVGFALLFLLLRKLLYQPIGSILERRREQIRTDRQEAERHRADMERRAGELEQRLSQIETEVRDRMQSAERESQKAREELLTLARAERDKIVEAGLAELRREREKTLVEIRNLVADLAVLAAGKIVEQELDVQAHRAMIDDIVEHGVR
ncbi:MAG: F0F1 ATP synthase subunit B [Armatimonadetes bacterium]|nr:F0F1 ATP synthase subunit B [Armatimonadota bacterium]